MALKPDLECFIAMDAFERIPYRKVLSPREFDHLILGVRGWASRLGMAGVDMLEIAKLMRDTRHSR